MALVAIAFLLSLGSCITFKINSLSPPEEVVYEIQLCKKINDSGELLIPVETASTFTHNSDPIYCFIRVVEVSREIRMKWKWYSPDQILFRESEEVNVNKEEVFLEEITAYDKISLSEEKDWQGIWQVVVLIDDKLIARKSFLLKSSK